MAKLEEAEDGETFKLQLTRLLTHVSIAISQFGSTSDHSGRTHLSINNSNIFVTSILYL
jgi:hypothetical protein